MKIQAVVFITLISVSLFTHSQEKVLTDGIDSDMNAAVEYIYDEANKQLDDLDLKGEKTDQVRKVLNSQKNLMKAYITVYVEGVGFLLKLKSAGILPGIIQNSHGGLDQDIGFKDGELFPYKKEYIFNVEGESDHQYLYTLSKTSKNSAWKLIKATKRNVKSKQKTLLILPNNEQQINASNNVKKTFYK